MSNSNEEIGALSMSEPSPSWYISGLPSKMTEYITGGLEEIDGWGINPMLARLFVALDRYQKLNNITGNLFELGVHHGRSAVLLSMMARPTEAAVFLDLFDRQNENIDLSGKGDRDIFEDNLRKWAPETTVEIVQGNSLELDFGSVPGLNAGVRFAHIDGGHYREVVLNDLRKTEEILCDGAIVVVDDFLHTGFPEVNEACNYYLEQGGQISMAPVALGNNKLVLVKETHQARLEAFLKTLGASNSPPNALEVRFHGRQVLCIDR